MDAGKETSRQSASGQTTACLRSTRYETGARLTAQAWNYPNPAKEGTKPAAGEADEEPSPFGDATESKPDATAPPKAVNAGRRPMESRWGRPPSVAPVIGKGKTETKPAGKPGVPAPVKPETTPAPDEIRSLPPPQFPRERKQASPRSLDLSSPKRRPFLSSRTRRRSRRRPRI